MTEYRGLVNQGATCYLNSLIQTLYMTPEFRRNIYKYMHDSRKIDEVDSIPYQLQKLFVKLQQNNGAVYTKGLRRSFQWTDSESFQQHDVQEFCRILFEAIQKVFKNDNWIEKLYSGTVVSEIACEKHSRQNPQIFMDLSLPIRNLGVDSYYKSVEECLREYIRPQKLEDKVQCEQCGQKVFVEKGMKFSVLPSIMTLQLNRFQLNYNTFQREKVNSFVYYPQILYMDKFLKPFKQLQINEIPKDLEQKTRLKAKQKSARTTDWGGDLSVTGKAIKRKNSDEIETKAQKVKFLDDENRDKREQITKQLSKEQQIDKSKQLLQDLKASKGQFDKKIEKISNKDTKKQAKKEEKKVYDSLEDDMLFGTFMEGIPKNDPISGSIGSELPKFEKTQALFQHEEEIFDIDKSYPPNTYILYSILVHNGGAYGGHYYAYIFNGQNWFCFNDNTVKKVSRSQIRKYGHPSQNSSYGTNAYLLFYYESNKFKADILSNNVQIPGQLLEKIEKDKVDISKQQERDHGPAIQRAMITQKVLFKVYWYGHQNGDKQQKVADNTQHEVIVFDDRYQATIKDLNEKVKAAYIDKLEDINDGNWRIRRYNKTEDTMYESYGQTMQTNTLDSLGFRDTCYIAIQTKSQQDQFQEFDPKNITIKLNVWRDNLTLLTQKYLKPKKMGIRDERSFKQFYEKVEKATGLKNPVIIKRTFGSGKSYEQFKLTDNQDKSLISIRFFNGINLYVEPENNDKLLWDQEFETERYRCLINYNNPKLGPQKNQQIYFDTRKTLGDLKQALSKAICINFEEFRIKKSQQSVSEMITYKKRLIDLRFVNTQYIYLEEGKSSKGSLIIKQGFVTINEGQIDYILGQQVCIQLEASIHTCAQIKEILAKKVSVAAENIRIRQYKCFQFGEIFHDTQSIQRMKDKSLVWQELENQDPKGFQFYVRVFDIINMELGPLLLIFVENTANYEELTFILEEETGIQADKILAWKATTNHIQKSLLFDIQWQEIRFIPKSIRQEPMYLTVDGEIIIVKEAQNPYHAKPMKKTEYSSDYSRTVGCEKPPKKESGMKITVVEEKQLEPQQQEEQKNENKQKQS